MDIPAIDETQTRAICDEIGEWLSFLLKSTGSEEKPDFDEKLEQLSSRPAMHE